MLQTAFLRKVTIDFTWFNVRADCSGAEQMWVADSKSRAVR